MQKLYRETAATLLQYTAQRVLVIEFTSAVLPMSATWQQTA